MVSINPKIPFESNPVPEQPPDDVDGYAILSTNNKGNLVFESLNGYKVPIFSRDGIQKIYRDEHGTLEFVVKLVGVQVNRLGKTSTDSVTYGKNTRVYVRHNDGTLTEYTNIEDYHKDAE